MIKSRVFALLLAGLSLGAQAEWQLKAEDSALFFVSIKSSSVAETHQFKTLDGRVDNTGNLELVIDLTSVDTAIEIRDERMREYLFNTEQHAKAKLTGALDVSKYQNLKPGESVRIEPSLTLSLHGQSQELDASLTLTKAADGSLRAMTRTPVIVNAGDFALLEGVEKLRELAGLPSIAQAVPVTAELVFTKAP